MERPVVVPRIGGFEETVLDGITGLLYRPGDFSFLSECLGLLLSSAEKRSQMGIAAETGLKDILPLTECAGNRRLILRPYQKNEENDFHIFMSPSSIF